MEQTIGTIFTAAIGAISAYAVSRLQEQGKTKAAKLEAVSKSRSLDLEYVRSIIDEQLRDLREERDRSHDEIIKLRERIAVLESQAIENERLRTAAIVRLQRENDELRKINDQMAIELRELHKQVRGR